jgi:hypothetical protein
MSRFVRQWSLVARAALVTVVLSIASCGPTRFAGSVTPVIEPPDPAAGADAGEEGGAGEAANAGADAISEAPGDDAADDAATPTDSPCVALCAVLAGTGCPPDPAACPVGCDAQIADLCGGESRTLLSCQAALSPADFNCDSRSHLVMDPSKCQMESDALVVCLSGL